MLEANPELTWRDVKYILAKTADDVDTNNEYWVSNSAGYKFNNAYGFGAINAEVAVKMARGYKPLQLGSLLHTNKTAKKICNTTKSEKSKHQIDYSLFIEFVELKIRHLDYENCNVNSFAAAGNDVVQYFTETFGEVNDLEIILTSPNNTEFSTVVTHSEVKKILNGEPLKLYINSFYGESGKGIWTLTLNDNSVRKTTPFFWSLKVYGTTSNIRKDANQ